MRDYRYPAVFPGEKGEALKDAAKKTGLSINQIIVRGVDEVLPKIEAEHKPPVDLSPIPDAVVQRFYAKMSAAEIADDNAMGRESLRAQRKERKA